MENLDLRKRTKLFALDTIELTKKVHSNFENNIIKKQLIRSGTSVGANTRAAFKGRSKKAFVAKIGIVIEEADESAYWFEILKEINPKLEESISKLENEANEIAYIFTSISKKHKNSL